MEILLVIAVGVVIVALVYFNRSSKNFDVNADGKVDVADAKAAVQNTVEGVKAAADVNKDGVVDVKDAEVVVEAAKTEVKKAATKAKETVKKAAARGRKPKAQK
jgi:hypothetical protein